MDKDVVIEIISGVEGHCVTLNNYRVAGQKPWGGGQVVHSFQTKQSQIDRALCRAQHENKPVDVVPVVRGEWEVAIGYDPNKKVQCQNCYKMAYEPTPYCPNCGSYNGGDKA